MSGIAQKVKPPSAGDVAFVGLAGWKITLAPTETWIDALDRAALASKRVRWLYAIQGPKDVYYKDKELDLARLAEAIAANRPSTVILAAHSSGAFVAHALLELIPAGPRVVYFNLDGGERFLSPKARARADEIVFVAATDPAIHTSTPHKAEMKKAAAKFHGEFLDIEAPESGCRKGATWCMHMTLITTRPHDPKKAGGEIDYTDFGALEPATAWLKL
ncbi:MAG: hypothetical protein U0414_13355 [Polyangiaceae bacterium]